MTDSWEEFDDGIYAHKTILYNEYSLQYNNNNTDNNKVLLILANW